MRAEALNDIREDFEELLFLYRTYATSLRQFTRSLSNQRDHPALPYLTARSTELASEFSASIQELTRLQKEASDTNKSDIDSLADAKWHQSVKLRTVIPDLAALLTATDWQSPTYSSTIHSEAGIQEGKIIANINDYKRDQHLNEADYQEQFLKEYVDGFKFPTGSYLTSSGMAALTTIITYLMLQQKSTGPVMIGKAMYFENTELLEMFFKEKGVIKVDEMNTSDILHTYDERQPDVLVFDSLSNTPTIAVVDILTILNHVARHAKKETYFIIDNSTLSVALQPLKGVRLPRKVKLIVFESLNKYHQFGLDRVTAGIIWYRGYGLEKLYYARDHAGTNIPDTSANALPSPNRKMLEKRLKRLNRNTHYLAHTLAKTIVRSNPKKIAAIIYPGLNDHPSFPWSKSYTFQGSYFVVSFRKPYQHVKEYQRFLKKVLDLAHQHGVSLNGGTSFGFNTTRVYLTARNTDYGMPFIRVSVGTENRVELEKLTDVFAQAIQSF